VVTTTATATIHMSRSFCMPATEPRTPKSPKVVWPEATQETVTSQTPDRKPVARGRGAAQNQTAKSLSLSDLAKYSKLYTTLWQKL